MTSDEQSLLSAVLDKPADDTPRLLYADWLEEQGHGERAEFIRVQCELATLLAPHNGRWPHEAKGWCDCDYCALCRRERKLWEADTTDGVWRIDFALPWKQNECHVLIPQNALANAAHHEAQMPRIVVKRGWPAEVSCTLADWIGGDCGECNGTACGKCYGGGVIPGHGPAIVAAQPVEVVRVTDKRPILSGVFWTWYSSGNRLTPEHTIIPMPIFDLLKPHSLSSGSSQIVHFHSEQAAVAALSAALIAWAKEQKEQA